MSKLKIKSLVPALRFPELSDAGEWLLLNGDKVFKQISNKNHNSDLPILAITQEYGAIPRKEIDYQVSVTDKSVESYKVVEAGDFIISLRSFQGGIEYSTYRGLCSPAYVVLRKKIDVNNHFFKWFFKTNIFIQCMNRNIEGIRDGKMVSYRQFSELLLPNPSPEEQQKIADCLASIEELITPQTQKLDALKAHKKSLMQLLFPAEGETVPKLRFPEFKGENAWEKKPFNKVFTRIKTKNSKNNQNVLTISAQQGLVSQMDYFNKSVSARDVTGYYLLHKGDFAYNKSYSQGYPMGAIKPLKYYEKGVVSTLYICFRAINEDSVDFYEQYFDAGMFNSEIEQIAQEGARNHGLLNVSVTDFFNKTMLTIPEKEEQLAIADCLSSIDELITAQSQKLDALKEHKKGLMQQLFPAMDEV